MALIERCYAINRSSNSIYYSDDLGITWTEIPSNLSTASASDIAANPVIFENLLVLSGANAQSTPYLSTDGGNTFVANPNIFGKEILYLSSSAIVTGGKRLKSDTGPEISISLDGGNTFSQPINTSNLFLYPGAIYNNITVMSVDFTSPAGGYIAIAGDEDNSLADQILARTFDRGNTFPDAIILPGSIYGVIRSVIGNPSEIVVFAAGEPGLPGRGKIYTINKHLSDIPVQVYSGITVGDSTNTRISKFFRRPNDATTGNQNILFFLDGTGRLLRSEDGGINWIVASTIPGNCVDIIAVNPSVLIAITESPNAIYRSVNNGFNWTQVAQPTWNNPEAVSYNEKQECFKCPPDYTEIGTIRNKRCEKFQISGPICKDPYQYFELDEVCASPTTIQPANIVYALDYSTSIDPGERQLFIDFIIQVNDLIADRLELGSIEIAIVKWSEWACLTLPFTSNRTDITNELIETSISCEPFGTFTNHVAAFCESVNALYQKAQERPDADNILIVFTDGDNNIQPVGCDLTSIGLNPSVAANASDAEFNKFLELANDAKNNFNGTGLKIMIVMVGSATDREEIRNQFLINPLANGYEPYPSKTPAGNYYLFDGGDFADVNSIVQQIRLGLASLQYPTEPCPEGCVGISGDDNFGYCSCRDEYTPVSCLYKLEECNGLVPAFYTTDEVFSYWFSPASTRGFIVTLVDENSQPLPGCYILSKVPDNEIDLIPESEITQDIVGPVDNYTSCELCGDPFYVQFTDCNEPTNVQYSTEVLDWQSNYISNGTTVVKSGRPDLSPSICWSGVVISELPAGAVLQDFTGWIESAYGSCPECAPVDTPSYKLSDTCENNLPDVYTDRDFSAYAGKIVKVLQYPGVCWACSLNLDENVQFEVLTPDGLAYDICQDCLPVAAVTYTLRDCNDEFNTIVTDSNLNQYLGGVVRLTTTGDTCWEVFPGSSPANVPQPVSVSQSFADCGECFPQIFRFINCQNPNNVIYTLLDFSQYLDQVINLQEYPGVCWTVRTHDDINVPLQNVTIQGDPYPGCPECLITYYQLTNCANPDVFLISTSTELSRYVGRTITAAGYTGLCFTVTEPKCDCVRIIVNGIEYNINAQSSLYNGRKLYLFETESGDQLGLGWSINPNRWELFNSQTLETYGFNTADTECPFSNFWTTEQGSLYIITSVVFCADDLYNIAPELEFADCEPCINCI
jgi:hypothetical protein